jgi:hypothetical protein
MSARLVIAIAVVVLALSRPATAALIIFNTSDNQLLPGVDNQGWWSATLANVSTNATYFTGESATGALLRSFFTFDLSSLDLANEAVTAVTLELARFAYDSEDESETIAFFDVSTDATTLNNNAGTSAAIFDDLGSGTMYGTFVVPAYTFSSAQTLSFPLNDNATAAVAAAAGGFFSIGAALTSITRGGGENEALFGSSSSVGIQRLIVETTAVVPEPTSMGLAITAMAGLALRKYTHNARSARKRLGRRCVRRS